MNGCFEIVALPGTGLQISALRGGDILLRRALGEGGLAHVAFLVSGQIMPKNELAKNGFTAEKHLPGMYACVIETGVVPRYAEQKFARRITDERGYLPYDQMVLRLKFSDTYSDDNNSNVRKPIYNLIQGGHNEVYTNFNKYRPELKKWRVTLEKVINERGRQRLGPDFRFMIPLAQRLVEQNFIINTFGNNPYNIMSTGDIGKKLLEDNYEIILGKRTRKPAYFGNFSTEELGIIGFFEQLNKKWPNAEITIYKGGSVKEYVNGLYPGVNNYATASHADYESGIRIRIERLTYDFENIIRADMKDVDEKITSLQSKLTELDKNKDAISWKTTDIELHQLKTERLKLDLDLLEVLNVRERNKKRLDIAPRQFYDNRNFLHSVTDAVESEDFPNECLDKCEKRFKDCINHSLFPPECLGGRSVCQRSCSQPPKAEELVLPPPVNELLYALNKNQLNLGTQILTPKQKEFIARYFLIGVDELAKRGMPRRNAVLLVAHTGVETSYGKLGPNPKYNNFLSFQPEKGPQTELRKMGIEIITEKRDNAGGPTGTPVPYFRDIRQSIVAQLEIAYGIKETNPYKGVPYKKLGEELNNSRATAQRYAKIANDANYGPNYPTNFPSEYTKSLKFVVNMLRNLPENLSSETKKWAAELLNELVHPPQ